MDRSTRFIVVLFCILKLSLHLIADYHSGFQGDELLHIEAGNHLSLGYMEFPPIIGWLAAIQNLFHSESVFVHHLFSHVAAIAIFIVISKITVTIGGGPRAVFLVLLCLLPVMGRSHQLFQPVVFSQLAWVVSFYYLTKYIQFSEKKDLWRITIAVSFGFMTKYDIVFFLFGLLCLFIDKETRIKLIRHKFWWNIIVFFIAISPNLIWQYNHDFPVLAMFSRLYETQLDELSLLGVMSGLVIGLNPFTLLIYVPGLFFLSTQLIQRDSPTRTFKTLGRTLFTSLLLLALSKGKSYYFLPILLTLFPFGALVWERFILKRKKWYIYPISIILLISGCILLPFSLPITTLESYLTHEYPYEKKAVEGGQYAVKEERYSTAKWNETLSALSHVLDSLPADQRKHAMIWAKHYSQAGAVALMGDRFGLPEAFSLHGSFYLWLPQGNMPRTIIAIRYSKADGSDFFEPYFEEVKPVKTLYNPYGDREERVWQTIFVCQQPKQDFDILKQLFAHRIFE